MPKLIDFFNVAELISVEKLSDMSDEKWNWRIDYVGYQCELFILESEEENKGKRYIYFTEHHDYLKTGYGTYSIDDDIITMKTKNTIYKFKIIYKWGEIYVWTLW